VTDVDASRPVTSQNSQ